MGIKIAGWQESLVESLNSKGLDTETVTDGDILLVKFKGDGRLVLRLIPVLQTLDLKAMQDLQSAYRSEGILLVQLWEDVWQTRPLQVLSRISSMLGRNRTVHGRKTKVKSVTQTEADDFFDRCHLQGSAGARYKYALTLNDEIVAMASFSAKRNMTRREQQGYTSVELIRFATIDGITVQGGLSKLIRHLVKTIAPNDVMTYADMDWSLGKGYLKLGFELAATLEPAEIWLNTENMTRYFPQRLPEEMKSELGTLCASERAACVEMGIYRRIYNSGSLKYILTV